MADDQAIATRMAAAREDAKLLRERAAAAAAANPFYKGKDINKASTNCYGEDGKRLLPRAPAEKGSVKTRKARAPCQVAASPLTPAPAPANATPVAAFDASAAATSTPRFPGTASGLGPASPISVGWQSAAAYSPSAPPTPPAQFVPTAQFAPTTPPAPAAPATCVPLRFTHRAPTVLEAINLGLHPFQLYPFETFDPPLWARDDPRGPPSGYRQPTFLEACQLGLHFYQASIPVWYGWRPATTDEAVLEERRRGFW